LRFTWYIVLGINPCDSNSAPFRRALRYRSYYRRSPGNNTMIISANYTIVGRDFPDATRRALCSFRVFFRKIILRRKFEEVAKKTRRIRDWEIWLRHRLARRSSRGWRASCEVFAKPRWKKRGGRKEKKELGQSGGNSEEWSVGGMGRANGATGVECARFYDGASERASERFDAEGALGRYHYANP